jgi:repressor LexA
MSNAGGLTSRQKRMLDFLNTFIMRKGISPSYAEMQDALGFRSKASVSRYLCALRERGYIDFAPGKARTIVVLFPMEGTPNWESIARALYLQNVDLRGHLKTLGWDVDVKAMTLPDSKKGKRRGHD